MTQTQVYPVSDEEKLNSTENIIIRRLRNIARLGGFYVGSTETTFLKSVGMVFHCLVVNLILSYHLFRLFYTAGDNILAVAFYIFYFSNIVITSLWMSYTIPKHFNTFLGQAVSLSDVRWSQTRFMKLYYIAIVTCIVIGLVGFFAVYLFEYLVPSLKHFNGLFNTISGNIKIFVLVLYGFFGFTVMASRFAVVALFSLVSCVLYEQFSHFTNRVIKDLEINLNTFESRLRRFWKEHSNMCQTIEHADRFITCFVSPLFLDTIPVVCALIYNIIHGQLTNDELVMAVTSMATSVFEMILVLTLSCVLNGQNDKLKKRLTRVDLTDVSEKSLHEMQWFMHKIRTDDFGYTVFGLFTIDTSTVLTIIGALATYIVVVLQMPSGA